MKVNGKVYFPEKLIDELEQEVKDKVIKYKGDRLVEKSRAQLQLIKRLREKMKEE